MRRYDLTPLLRSSIGFDHFDRLFDAVNRADGSANGYPPYNIEKSGDDGYRITMAVAGFREADLSINLSDNTLSIAGEQKTAEENVTYLHRGIAGRTFERRFQLAEDIRVTAASLENGLLHIDLVREVPEHKKPRQIEIASTDSVAQVEASQAA